MTRAAKLYYIAGVLALIAIVITAMRVGMSHDNYVYLGALLLLSGLMFILGSREKKNDT